MTKEPETKSNSTPIIIELDDEEKKQQVNVKVEPNEKTAIEHAIFKKRIEYFKLNKQISKGKALYLIIEDWEKNLKGES